MDDTAKLTADELTEKALSEGPFADFREAYRERLRWLKDNQPRVFATALAHYNDVLVPNIANGSDPVSEWTDYGKRLGELSGKGKFVCVDETGRAHDYDDQSTGLLLHVPDDTAVPAFALMVPRDLSEAQQATLDLLIRKG